MVVSHKVKNKLILTGNPLSHWLSSACTPQFLSASPRNLDLPGMWAGVPSFPWTPSLLEVLCRAMWQVWVDGRSPGDTKPRGLPEIVQRTASRADGILGLSHKEENKCWLRHPVYGILLWKPEQNNMLMFNRAAMMLSVHQSRYGMGHMVEKKVRISDAHRTWSPKGWGVGASRGSITFLNVGVLLLMVSGHRSSSEGALEEAANMDKWRPQIEWEREARDG